MCRIFVLLVFIPFAGGFSFGRTQSAGARGVLLCHGKPESNVLVKLYDDDLGPDTDDLMASAYTNAQGSVLRI
jgi:hypothetical protein